MMTDRPHEKLSEATRRLMLEHLNLGVLDGLKDIGASQALVIRTAQNNLSTAVERDPVASTLINALSSAAVETEKEINQIIPAQGWTAVFAAEPDRFNSDLVPLPRYIVKPLICWALKRQFNEAEQKHNTVVVGIIDNKKTTIECSKLPGFLAYRGPGCNQEDASLIETWFNWYDERKIH